LGINNIEIFFDAMEWEEKVRDFKCPVYVKQQDVQNVLD
jgi:hypothetical protein